MFTRHTTGLHRKCIALFAISFLFQLKGLCQQDSFLLRFHTIRKSNVEPGVVFRLPDSTVTLQLSLPAMAGTYRNCYINVLLFDEKSEHPITLRNGESAGFNVELLTGEDPVIISDTTKTYELCRLYMGQPDSFKLAVIISKKPVSIEERLFARIGIRSLFKLFYSDLAKIPSQEETSRLLQERDENLQRPEPDIQALEWAWEQDIMAIKIIEISTIKEASGLAHSYQVKLPLKDSSLLTWNKTAYRLNPALTKDDMFMNKLIGRAGEKHLELIQSRGVEEDPVERYKFSLKEIMEVLTDWKNNKIGILLYSLNDSSLDILYANNDGLIDTVRMPLKSNLLSDLENNLKALLKNGHAGIKTGPAYRGGELLNKKHAGKNLDSVINMASNLLLPKKFNLDRLEHLVIIPTMNIGAFPFAMMKITDSTLLIDKMSYSIVPSINEFIINGKTRGRHYDGYSSRFDIRQDSLYWNFNKPVLFVGNPEARLINGSRFEKLPGTAYEINELSKKVMQPKILMGKDAVKSGVLKALPDADILYFASHAVSDAQDPLHKSFILLSGKGDEGILTAKEIQSTDLTAALVVLSACETGLGKSHEGGMIGLARAFEIAGAKNVLMSLWQISDSKTPQLMRYFFEAMENNGNGHIFFPHEAFRKAILEFRKENNDPSYWAAFSIFGVPL